MIQYFYTLQSDHCDKSSYHLSPYKVTEILLDVFPMYISFIWLIFVPGSLYFLIFLTYFTHSSTVLPSDNHLFVFCIYESVSVCYVCSFAFLDSISKWNHMIFLLYWLCQHFWLCRSQQIVENSSRDGNTRPPDLPPEKSVCRSRSNS